MSVLDLPKPLTQRDIARALGVSVATVSLALRNRPVLSESTRREIQEFAIQAGYRLDEAAAELSGRKKCSAHLAVTENIAWITTNPGETADSPAWLADCLRGAEATAKNLGYRLEEFELGSGLNPARLHQILRARGIRGMLLPPRSEALDWKNFPWECYSVVKLGHSMLHPTFHSVAPDYVGNTMKAFRALLSRGYRRIGFFTRETGIDDCEGCLTEAGFVAAQRLVEVENRIPVCVISKGSDEAETLTRWVKANRVEAVLTDLREAPVLLQNVGLQVPEDIGLAITNLASLSPSAGIDSHHVEIGKSGVHLLHSLISENERGITEAPRQLLVNGAWTEGDSLPERRAATNATLSAGVIASRV